MVVTLHAVVIFLDLLYTDAKIKRSRGSKAVGCWIALLLSITILLYLVFTPGSWAEGLCIRASSFSGNELHDGQICSSQVLQSCLVNSIIFVSKLTFSQMRSGNCIILTKPVRFDRESSNGEKLSKKEEESPFIS